jgi:hypothetical protein
MAESLLMARTTTTDASEGPTACADLVATLEAPKASPSSPTLEGETTLNAFLLEQRRWRAARTAATTHLHPVSLASKSSTISKEATTGLHVHLLGKVHINSVGH